MLVTSREKYRLDRDDIQKGTEAGAATEAANLLYSMMDEAIAASGDNLEIEVNNNRETIRSLYRKCCNQIETVARAGDKAGFLVMAILKNTFDLVLPLMMVPLEDLLHGDDKSINEAKRFQELVESDPSLAGWKGKESSYRKMLESVGMSISGTDYSDLSAIIDPLTNAFAFYQNKRLRIYQARTGKRSTARPALMSEVCKFRSEKELVDAISACGKECVIAFGGIEKTNGQQKDYFSDWLRNEKYKRPYWMPDIEDKNSEEYLSQVNQQSRRILLCVKAGECIYLLWMPYESEYYQIKKGPDSKYVYGRRAGYAPMEIFYEEPPAAEIDTTFLAIPKKAWKLNELMDDMQKIWLPVFFEETYEKFFKEKLECEPIIFPEEMQAVITEPETGRECGNIVPIGYGKPAVCTYRYEVPEPDGLFAEEPVMEKLITHFHITGQELSGVPILPRKCVTPQEADAMLAKNMKNAYIRTVSQKLAAHMEQAWDIRDWVVNEIYSRRDMILDAAREGKFLGFQSDIVAGRPILDKDGNPKMHRSNRPPYREVPDTELVSTDHYRVYPIDYLRANTKTYRTIFDECPATSKPAVVVRIRPKTTEDYRTLFAACGKEMPEFFQLADEIKWFCHKYDYLLGRHIIDKTAWNNRTCASMDRGSVSFPSFADINICTTKRNYKKYKKEKDEEK